MASNNENIVPVNGTGKQENGDSENQNHIPNPDSTNQNNETGDSFMM